MNGFDRKYTVTEEMVKAYEDIIGEKNPINRKKVPNGLIHALINDTVWRTLGDGTVIISLNLVHIKPIASNTDLLFSMTLISGSDTMSNFMITVGGSETYNVVGHLTIKRFKIK